MLCVLLLVFVPLAAAANPIPGAPYQVGGRNFPTDFITTVNFDGQPKFVNGGAVDVTESSTPVPGAVWLEWTFTTVNGGPLAGNPSGVWGLGARDLHFPQPVIHRGGVGTAFVYFTIDGVPQPMSLGSAPGAIGAHPLDPSIQSVWLYDSVPGPLGDVQELIFFLQPYASSLAGFGPDPARVNGVHFGVLLEVPSTPDENLPPICDAGGPYQQSTSDAARVVPVDGSMSSDPDGDPLTYLWTTSHPNAVFDSRLSPTPQLVVGRAGSSCLEEATVFLELTDGREIDSCQSTVTLTDETPPTVTVSCQDGLILWSPNHELTPIGLSVSVDDCDLNAGRPDRVVVEVWSDEPEFTAKGGGDGKHAPDAKDFGQCLAVRNERSGSGNGRVYLVAAAARDSAGNSGFGYCTVVVPKSRRGADVAAVQAEAQQLLAYFEQNPGASPADVGLVRHGESAEIGPKQEIAGSAPSCNNGAPLIVSSPEVGADLGAPYVYDVDAIDPENEPLAYGLNVAPVGMKIDATTGVIDWTPDDSQLGIHEVAIEVRDPDGGVARQRYYVALSEEINLPPIITSLPVTSGAEGEAYAYDVEALDLENEPLAYDLVVAPSGMSIDFGTGLISWTPSAVQAGSHAVNLVVCDPDQSCTSQPFEIVVAEALNNSPSIDSTPVGVAAEGVLYRYDVDASDADGDLLGFSLLEAPAGMSINPSSGLISWAPSAAQNGLHDVRVQASDSRGGVDTQDFVVEVVDALNGPPSFISTAATAGGEGALYSYDADAVDPEGTALSYVLLAGPSGMTIDATTGLVSWTPADDQSGTVAVTIQVTDALGATATQSFNISVTDLLNAPPRIVSLPQTDAIQGQGYLYLVVATDPEGDPGLQFSLVTAPPDLTIDATTGTVAWVPDYGDVGTTVVTVRVTDSGGASGTQTYALTVIGASDAIAVPELVGLLQADAEASIASASLGVGGVSVAFDQMVLAGRVADQSPVAGTLVVPGSAIALIVSKGPDRVRPVAEILAPAPESQIRAPFQIVGNVLDAGDPSITLSWEVRIAPVGSSDFRTVGVGAGEVVNAVLAQLDPTLLANDSYMVEVRYRKGAATGSVFTRYHVLGELKLGNFRLQFTDLAVPLAGIPITVGRRYDTLDLSQGDFGFGWQIALPGSVRDGVPAGQTFTSSTRVYVTKPDGKRVGFTFTPFSCSGLFPLWCPAFTPDPGVYDRLSVASTFLFNAGGVFYEFADDYNPSEYVLTTKEGLVHTLDESRGLLSTVDRNGNTLTVTPSGVAHSSGVSIGFVRDAAGNITEVVDPAGNRITYTYGAGGELVSVADQVGGTTYYTYLTDPAHFLDTIVDLRGEKVFDAEFDGAGRLVGSTDALGNSVHQSFDPDSSAVAITDARGNITVLEYDERGNIVSETDPLGGVTLREYDENDNEIATTDARGFTTRREYDELGNVTRIEDPSGAATILTYVPGTDNLASVTDRLGRVTTFAYDAAGNLTRRMDALGGEIVATYDTAGRATSITDEEGNTTVLEYVATSLQPHRIVHPDNESRSFEYNAIGQVTAIVNEVGGRFETDYDSAGRTTERRGPNGQRLIITYDGSLVASEANALGEASTFEYDAAGRLKRQTGAEGGVIEYAYDASGNRTRLTDPVGNITEFAYDALNRLVARTDARGNTATFDYDGAGNRIEIVDRNGRQRQFEYDRLGREIAERWMGSSGPIREIQSRYDVTGNLIAKFDHESAYEITYDDLDRVITVDNRGTIDVPRVVLSYAYDGRGNVISVRDDDGVEIESAFGPRGELEEMRWFGPTIDETRVVFDYDPTLERVSVERYSGARVSPPLAGRTDIVRDASSRPTAMRHADAGGNPLVDYLYEYDMADRLTLENSHGESVSYAYDATGQLTEADRSVRPDESYRYDANGNRVYSHRHGPNYETGQDNTLLSDGIHQYTYDAEGNLIGKREFTTGDAVGFRYDHQNRLVAVVGSGSMGGVSMIEYRYDVLGQRVLVRTDGSIRAARIFDRENTWAEYSGLGDANERYLFGLDLDSLTAKHNSASGVVWYLLDRQRTVRDLASDRGESIASVEYESFGGVVSESGAIPLLEGFRYNSRSFDEASGLYDYRARELDPATGRFLQQDPLGFEARDPNLYRFVNNSQPNFRDPTGTVALTEVASRNSAQLKPLLAVQSASETTLLRTGCVAPLVLEVVMRDYKKILESILPADFTIALKTIDVSGAIVCYAAGNALVVSGLQWNSFSAIGYGFTLKFGGLGNVIVNAYLD